MSAQDRIERRRLLGTAATLGGLAVFGHAAPLLAQKIRRTPAQILGPFYPLVKPLDQDADLTMIKGRPGRAAGQAIHVMGRVTDAQGRALPGVRIEIWQANAHGRYTHPSDNNPAPLDPHFEGYAVLRTDAEGRYRFKTIKPGAYPADAGVMRPPHIHFDIAGRVNRTVTQLYFAGEPLNDDDALLRTVGANRERLIVSLEPPTQDLEPDSLLARWDIVLDKG
ncbi:protocatechuate 3,4-dioxygenase [Luteimonas sp. SX5]|uniref:Protocatechuate 3,4-dioxygenase n=1 Tax=Luteimonas galliterrae TaxID=2940486 RepID=A0ABT0MEE3_9GAMM|nr:protocatechuate 3,4-dioxygenase [Luteimonas galliterrae]MCL1633241.1 protocatechuate 3,4-dioxygenase [Luteimonas galliterrae]